jgi:hypothetical protein
LPVARPALADGIKVSPSIIEKTITPGEVFEQAISITNESASNMKIYIFLRDFTADGEEGSPKLLTPGSNQGSYMSSWISDYEVNGVDIGPGASHNFNFKITVPKEAGPGGYYGALVFGTKAEDIRTNSGDKGAASAISQQAGALLLLQVPGDANEAASIRDFFTDKSVYNMPFNVNFTTRVENQGNVHIKPRGVVQISNMFDKEVATVKVNDIAANVLPKSVRKFGSSWADKTGFGRYKATLAMTYGAPVENGGNGQQSLTSVTYFWVIPWKIVAFTALALLLIALVIYLLLRHYKKQAMEIATREIGIDNIHHQRMATPEPSKHLSIMMGIILLLLLILLAVVIFLLFA